jgi:NAD(P)-dependent dehydrogenase (short-subunit alcohol dehydrogenase family)
MSVNLENKVALVTGGAARLGRAIALGLAGAGTHVVVHYNSSSGPADETAGRVRALERDALVVQADLAKPEAARSLARAALDRFGRVDVLVHSASPFVAARLAATSLEDWRRVMAAVVESLFLLVQDLSPGMVEREDGGIVAILDRGAFDPWPNFLAHGVAKSALWALCRSLAVDLAPQVRVNAVVSGPVLPPPGYTDAQVERLARNTLLGRWGNPQDVVDAVLFLLRTDFATGEALFVDGGERWAHRKMRSRHQRNEEVTDGR